MTALADRLLTPREAADVLRVSLDTLEGLAVDGSLPFINVGRGKKRPTRRFSLAAIERFILDRTQQGKPSQPARTPKTRTNASKSPSNFLAIRAALLRDKPKR